MSRRPPILTDVQLAADGEGIYTFSNGTEYEGWADCNCWECHFYDFDGTAGESCAFEGAALLGMVTPELAALFGWIRDAEDAEKYGERSAWSAPRRCAFFADRDLPAPPPPPDPDQLALFAEAAS